MNIRDTQARILTVSVSFDQHTFGRWVLSLRQLYNAKIVNNRLGWFRV